MTSPVAIVLPPTVDARKAIAFVEALSAVERDYGYVVGVGLAEHVTDGQVEEPVYFGTREEPEAFLVVRGSSAPGDLRLALPT